MNIATKKPKVVLDTNVFVSGLNFRGNERKIVELFRKGELKVVASSFIFKELEKILRKKFNWPEHQVEYVVNKIKTKTILVEPKIKLSVIKTKKSDNHILECAFEGKAGFIISGDKRHILPLNEFRAIKILSPAEFLKLLRD